MDKNPILLTGGAGFVGSHTVVELLEQNYQIVVADNLDNSLPKSLERIQEIVKKDIIFHKLDITDEKSLEELFSKYNFSCVIHFAGKKAVGESAKIPLSYYENNVGGTIALLKVMTKFNVKNMVFSSSATVYGDPASVPIREDFPLTATNPYGRTKLMIEQILDDLYLSDNEWNIIKLRYFNPVGAHSSGLIGEDPAGIPNNLMPYISQVAIGKLKELSVFGGDYNTKDGTGVRDYIHVVDLAKGHIAAVRKIEKEPHLGCVAYNLGTGQGYSVLEMLRGMEKACGKKIDYKIVDRRVGDVAQCYADPTLAKQELNWEATLGIDEMCADSWRWQQQNPNGYRD